MRLIAGSIKNPIAIGVVVLLICLFGYLSLRQLPLQLFPDIERPTIGVLNVAAGVEGFLRSPSFRPSFRVHWGLSLLGAAGCLVLALQ